MRLQGAFTSVSWIPSEAVKGIGRAAFDHGVTHYDEPPPDRVPGPGTLVELRDADRFRFANDLRAWIDVEDGRVVDAGYEGGGLIGSTIVRLGRLQRDFQAVLFPTIQHDPQLGTDRVRFVQTVGGRTGLPAPRRVSRAPFVQLQAPTVWTTLALTLHVDGTTTWDVDGHSPFPRHWFYDADGALVAKNGLAEFEEWWRGAFGKHSPWGDEDSPALITTAETALERVLATQIMRGGEKPQIAELATGEVLLEQGAASEEIYLVLDGVVRADVDGEPLAEYGPGALLGERAALEGGRRTATVTALTPTRVAIARAGQLDPAALAEVSQGHRHEEDEA